MKDFLQITVVSIIGGIIIFFVNQLRNVGSFDISMQLQFNILIVYLFYTLCLIYANYFLFNYLDSKISWKKEPTRRIIIGLISSVIITLLVFYLLEFVGSFELNGINLISLINESQTTNLYYALFLALIISFNFHIIYFYKFYNEIKVAQHQFEAKTETARFESLKNQIDPHFLFNSLNVLTSLISENPALAEKFTTKLSKVYRYVLEQKDKEVTPLQEEIDFAKTYIDLLKIRFEETIYIDLPTEISNLEYKILPLSLQLLLENVFKHNAVSSSKTMNIKIYEENGYLVISNTLNPKTSMIKSTQIGLRNIIDRYALLTEKDVIIEKTKENFIVKLPLLLKKRIIMETINNEQERYLKAQKRVEELKEFYSSLFAYCVVIPFLIFINYQTYWGFQWFWFPMFGWGIGLAFQAYRVYGHNNIFGLDWEEKKIREFMNEKQKKYWE